MVNFWQKIIGCGFLILTLSGCGDLSQQDVVKRPLESSRLRASCQMNVDAFTRILHDNISSDIYCLKENLQLFLRLVETDLPNHLSKVAFEAFIVNNRPDISPEIVKAIKSVFDINHLITGEDPNYISERSIDKLVKFALIFNEQASLYFGETFENKKIATFNLHQKHQQYVSKATIKMVRALKDVFVPDRGTAIHKLNLHDLIDSFSTPETLPDMLNFKKVLFGKKVLLGGEENIVTHSEIKKLLNNDVENLAVLALDVVRYEYIVLNQKSLIEMIKNDVDNIFKFIFAGDLNNRDTTVLFDLDQVIEAIKAYVSKDDLDIGNMRDMVLDGKRILMGGHATNVTGRDLKNLFGHANSLIKTGTGFHRIYEQFKAQLDNPGPVDINFSNYRHTFPDYKTELDQFERIVKNYRVFKGEFLSPYYSVAHRRNPDAIFEFAFWEYAIKQILKFYGKQSTGIGGWSIDVDQVRTLLKKYENELVDLKLFLPGMARMNADNIALLGSLFEFQSDDNSVLDINEGAEFAVNLVTSIKGGNDILEYLKEKSKCKADQFNRVEPNCFKTNFMKAFCSLYRPYFPRLFEAYNLPGKCADIQSTGAVQEYLEASYNTARACNFYPDGDKEEIYYSEGDIMTIMMVLMHVEATVMRWDKNQNNYMDIDEVESAYSVYYSALEGLLKDKNPLIRRFQKQIYLYLIKYETVPDEKQFGSIMKFVKFLLKFNKRSTADRKTIASILYQIGEQNKKLPGYEAFDCKGMRDPDNIPRNPRPVVNETKPLESDFSDELIPYLHLADPKE